MNEDAETAMSQTDIPAILPRKKHPKISNSPAFAGR
jgi:hypothetical protein